MTGDAATQLWLQQQAAILQRKQAMLDMLRESLSEWEREVDWNELSAEQRARLTRLAEESASTLRSMIERLETDLATERSRKPEGAG